MRNLQRFGILSLAAILLSAAAVAQGGSCHDPWINQAYNRLYHRAPNGTGVSGECNINLYGHGHWSSFQDLENKIRASKASPANGPCRDPWINQAYNQLYHRAPNGSGVSGECNIYLYGHGHWSSFQDLENKIRMQTVRFHVGSNGALLNWRNQVLVPPGQFSLSLNGRLIQPRAGQVIAVGSGALVSPGNSNIIAVGSGSIIAVGSGSFHGGYGVQSAHATKQTGQIVIKLKR